MDKKEQNQIDLKSNFLILQNDKYRLSLSQRKYKKSEFIKQNKETKINFKNKRPISFFKFVTFFSNLEKFFLIYFINFILLNLKGILCESYIIVKINKSGHYNFLFKGGISDPKVFCNGVSKHTPNSICINNDPINKDIDEYDFVQPVNTIKLYFDDTKDFYACLFNGCSDLDEIDASHLITSSVYHMGDVFHSCETSLDLSNFNTANVKYMNGLFYGCHNLKYLDIIILLLLM